MNDMLSEYPMKFWIWQNWEEIGSHLLSHVLTLDRLRISRKTICLKLELHYFKQQKNPWSSAVVILSIFTVLIFLSVYRRRFKDVTPLLVQDRQLTTLSFKECLEYNEWPIGHSEGFQWVEYSHLVISPVWNSKDSSKVFKKTQWIHQFI